ncbi:uracil-DNA glycosylase [Nocardioides sp. Bht2]|uniref:uracil-DNA glycosylase n=1 Tax=Nocardioides sp. Bht2 TaxID=3392297 RepID=UPI0039B6E3E5
MAADWADALAPVAGQIEQLYRFLDAEATAGRQILPERHQIWRAFARPMSEVRVVIVGQDPYPTPGHPVGLSFSVADHVRPVPRSLVNIYAELDADLAIPPAADGDLSAWADQGVMLLNRVLTVRTGAADSHRGKGWETITDQAIGALAARGGPLVVILWGAKAQRLAPLLNDVAVIASPHPSPLSARKGFFGSKPFSAVNAALAAQGTAPIDWRLG